MATPIICRPPSFPIRRILNCPTEGRRRRMAGIDGGPYYGPTLTCLGCGDAWTCGEMHERPFQRGWRQKAVAAAKRAWEEAGRYTRAEYDAWLAAELAAATADSGRPAKDLPLPESAQS
ncbi:hypothetical protein K4749_01150 [Streptomyces sp. TRM72054]|uniref:hypothetical protein n=1 Tax=Streptomyces sp. TRM72054 TaxID=2870562 RepID=UPI001C8BEEAE|nr:hypothetical protein [Streptomyces sp. TRM72054]MBX9392237.1 hypothetical protein [Streptomyces sp. TRM72054]